MWCRDRPRSHSTDRLTYRAEPGPRGPSGTLAEASLNSPFTIDAPLTLAAHPKMPRDWPIGVCLSEPLVSVARKTQLEIPIIRFALFGRAAQAVSFSPMSRSTRLEHSRGAKGMMMNRMIEAALASATMASVLALGASFAYAQDINDSPLSEEWWPSEFGAQDRAGSVNRVTPETVIKAIKLVRTGKTATLGKYYDSEIPLGGSRIWNMVLPGTPAAGPLGSNQVVAHDEYVSAEIGQVGTQFDGPGHIGVRTSKGDLFYNGREREATYQRDGFGRPVGMGELGVEHVAEKAFVCRGVILDAAKYRGMNPLPIPTATDSPGIISAEDVKAIVKAQRLEEIEAGDCVFLHTGHGDLWKNSIWKSLSSEERRAAREKFSAGEPGFGRSACEYLAERRIALMGGDTSSNDAMPVGEIEGEIFPCHQIAQTHHGIWNIENLDLEPLVEEGVYEFLFVWSPLKIVGATGSPGNPVALW